MATAGFVVILAVSGDCSGRYDRSRRLSRGAGVRVPRSVTRQGSNALPDAVRGSVSMAAAGKTIVLATSGSDSGKLVLFPSVVVLSAGMRRFLSIQGV